MDKEVHKGKTIKGKVYSLEELQELLNTQNEEDNTTSDDPDDGI